LRGDIAAIEDEERCHDWWAIHEHPARAPRRGRHRHAEPAAGAQRAERRFGRRDRLRVEKAFAAGADIKEMAEKTYMQAYQEDFITRGWERVAQCRKPVVAAVGGFALGGGCEVAMMCDIVIAAENARFGQPEINLGTMPGAGGTQRLPRFIGKAKAMDLCLTGRMMDAAEAERAGLVSRIVPADKLLEEAIAVAERIGQLSRPIAMMVKEAVNRAFETTLAEGVRFERRLFHSTFATEDQKEGMAAFIAKRKPAFKNR
jgi:enoyl-CoA hydratase